MLKPAADEAGTERLVTAEVSSPPAPGPTPSPDPDPTPNPAPPPGGGGGGGGGSPGPWLLALLGAAALYRRQLNR
ncbi:MAG: GlyGly-CTERM sorting domain-containing protein [Pseudomonadota bacterium]